MHLSWIFHQAGDIHMPLHAVARFSKALPQGDRGGYEVHIPNPRARGGRSNNLHAYWDDLVSTDQAPAAIEKMADELILEFPRAGFTDELAKAYIQEWAEVSVQICSDVASEHGESFSGCKITEVCPEGPDDALEIIARDWLETIQERTGNLVHLFTKLGIDDFRPSRSWSDERARALYHVFMTYLGHGVGFSDFCHDWSLENPIARIISTGDDSAVQELAQRDYEAQHADEEPTEPSDGDLVTYDHVRYWEHGSTKREPVLVNDPNRGDWEQIDGRKLRR